MSKFLRDEYGRNAQSHTVRAMLGLAPLQKIPAQGMPARYVQGILVWVDPLPERPIGRRRRRATHRVRALCPDCGQTLSAGRMHQHKCPEAK